MPFGSTSNTRLAYIAETVFGITPPSPVFKALRRTSGGPTLRKGTVISGQVSSSREVRAEPQVSQDVQGSIAFEFSHATLDDFLEAALGGTWATNVLKTGSTARSFTFENTLPVGATSHYHRYVGCSVNTMELSIQGQSIIGGSIGIMGQKTTALQTAILSGATYTAENAEPIFTADKVASLSVLGGTPIVKNLSLSINNNLRKRQQVGSLYSNEFGQGLVEITGRLEAYFDSNTLFQSVMDHGTGVLSFNMGVDANKKYAINLLNLQLNNGEVINGGRDDDVMVNIDFRAVYSVADSSSIIVTRLVA